MLSFRLKKQTSKNLGDTIFNYNPYFFTKRMGKQIREKPLYLVNIIFPRIYVKMSRCSSFRIATSSYPFAIFCTIFVLLVLSIWEMPIIMQTILLIGEHSISTSAKVSVRKTFAYQELRNLVFLGKCCDLLNKLSIVHSFKLATYV